MRFLGRLPRLQIGSAFPCSVIFPINPLKGIIHTRKETPHITTHRRWTSPWCHADRRKSAYSAPHAGSIHRTGHILSQRLLPLPRFMCRRVKASSPVYIRGTRDAPISGLLCRARSWPSPVTYHATDTKQSVQGRCTSLVLTRCTVGTNALAETSASLSLQEKWYLTYKLLYLSRWLAFYLAEL